MNLEFLCSGPVVWHIIIKCKECYFRTVAKSNSDIMKYVFVVISKLMILYNILRDHLLSVFSMFFDMSI